LDWWISVAISSAKAKKIIRFIHSQTTFIK
jgi:hypothetical protein